MKVPLNNIAGGACNNSKRIIAYGFLGFALYFHRLQKYPIAVGFTGLLDWRLWGMIEEDKSTGDLPDVLQ